MDIGVDGAVGLVMVMVNVVVNVREVTGERSLTAILSRLQPGWSKFDKKV